jgi:hypothetical protein
MAIALVGSSVRARRWSICVALCLSGLSCGGGGGSGNYPASTGAPGASTASGANVTDIVVDAGPAGVSSDVNVLFATVTVCVPGDTTSCETIDHIQVDTGSYGLRILAPALTLSLPVQKAASGDALLECAQFVGGYHSRGIFDACRSLSGHQRHL